MLASSKRNRMSMWKSTIPLSRLIVGFLLAIFIGAVPALGSEQVLIPEEAPQWVRDLPTQTESGGIRFPVRVSTEAGSSLTEEEFRTQLVQEIRTTLSELRLEDTEGQNIDITLVAASIPTFTPSYIAENWIKSNSRFESESEFGGVKLENHWRLVDISAREIGNIIEQQQSLKRQKELRNLGSFGFWAIIAISGCAAFGSKVLRKKGS